MDDELLGRQHAVSEARCLLALLQDGSTVEELRTLIAVPPTIEAKFRAFAGL